MNKVNGMGVGLSDEWYTPKNVFDAMGEHFDLDVASPKEGPLFVPADNWLYENSLQEEWFGFVWMNPPFGGRNTLKPWLEKFFSHGNGVALTPDRTSSPWFFDAMHRCDALLFTKGKTPFLNHLGNKVGSPAFDTTLWASGGRAVEALHRAEACGLGTVLKIAKRD